MKYLADTYHNNQNSPYNICKFVLYDVILDLAMEGKYSIYPFKHIENKYYNSIYLKDDLYKNLVKQLKLDGFKLSDERYLTLLKISWK